MGTVAHNLCAPQELKYSEDEVAKVLRNLMETEAENIAKKVQILMC